MASSNRFDTSVQQQYVSQYVPLPFEAIAALGEKIQKKQDAAIDDTYKLKDLMAKVPAIYDPNLGLSNIQKKKELDAQFAPKIDELSNKILAGDPNAYRELEQVKRDLVNNPIRQELEESYLNYKAYKEDITKKGGKYDRLLDDYYGQQLVDQSGELKPFRYAGMEESLDAPKRFKEIMGDIAEDARSWDVESLGADGIKIGQKGKRAGVDEAKVNRVVNNKVGLALNTDEGKQFVKRLRRLKPNITNEEILGETRKALFSSAYEQIGSDIESGKTIGLTDMWTREQNKKDAFAGPMPTYENPVLPSGTTLTPKSGLSWLGINTDVINDDGSINQGLKLTTTPGGIVTKKEVSGKKELTDFYSSLLNTARGLGLEIPKMSTDKSKTDFDKLQKQLADYGQNMQLQGNTSAGLQSRFGNNLSDELLGTVTSSAEGETVFKKSPILATAKLTNMSTGESISNIDDKENIAKDGSIRAVDYFASTPGTYRLDSQNKAYEYYPGDKTLNAMTQNTHSLTQEIVKARQGKQGAKTVIDSKNNLTVGDYANNVVNSLKTNFATIPANDKIGMALATDLSNNLSQLVGYEPISIKTSDIRIQEGPNKGQPKYQYVAYQQKGFGTTNKTDEKILQVDTESGKTEVITLGDLHANERDYLQQNYAPAFEKSK
jgi:hypothetical protein